VITLCAKKKKKRLPSNETAPDVDRFLHQKISGYGRLAPVALFGFFRVRKSIVIA
jgi:hypothetical protein